jgi:hypothetical protein
VTTVYLACAVVGGLVLIIQFILSVAGMGHDGFDADHGSLGDHAGDHGDSNHFLSVLSVRAASAAIAFFGIGGLLAMGSALAPVTALATALGAGAVAMFFVAWVMRLLGSLSSEGTVDINRVIGLTGTVYLAIPGDRTGTGKVTVKVQNRTMEYPAVTAHDALPTGAPVVIVGVIEPDTLEVEAATTKEGTNDAT